MKVNNIKIGDYPIGLDCGNEDFKKLIDELWTPSNPKGVNKDSMRWVKCSFLCYNLFPLTPSAEALLQIKMSTYLCKTLIYGWSKPIDKHLFLNQFWCEDYLGLPHDEDPWFYGQSPAYTELEKGFNLSVWEKLKPFLLELGEVPNIDNIVDAGKPYFTEV